MGLARKIMLTPEGRSHPMYEGKPTVFDAFTSHEDEVTHIPIASCVLATNHYTSIQVTDCTTTTAAAVARVVDRRASCFAVVARARAVLAPSRVVVVVVIFVCCFLWLGLWLLLLLPSVVVIVIVVAVVAMHCDLYSAQKRDAVVGICAMASRPVLLSVCIRCHPILSRWLPLRHLSR
jgi:hypothetical protein